MPHHKISRIAPPSHQLATDNRAPPEASICCPVTHRKSSESTAAITAPLSREETSIRPRPTFESNS